MSTLSLNDCRGGKGSGPVFEALQVTLGNIGSIKASAGPGVVTYDNWEQGIRDAMKAAMRPRWELLVPSGSRFKIVGELPPEQTELAERIVASVNLLAGIDLKALKVLSAEGISPFRLEQAADRLKALTAQVNDMAERMAEMEMKIRRGPQQADLFGAKA